MQVTSIASLMNSIYTSYRNHLSRIDKKLVIALPKKSELLEKSRFYLETYNYDEAKAIKEFKLDLRG